MHIITIMRYYYSPYRKAKIKRTTSIVDEEVEQPKLAYFSSGM